MWLERGTGCGKWTHRSEIVTLRGANGGEHPEWCFEYAQKRGWLVVGHTSIIMLSSFLSWALKASHNNKRGEDWSSLTCL